MRSPASVRCLPQLWLPALPIRRSSDQVATSRPGSGWWRSSTQAGARTGSAVSASKVTAICAACSMAGALAVIRYAKIHGTKHRPWLTALLARRPSKVAAIALANKIARIAWAIMVPRRALQGTRRACGVNEIAPDLRRDVTVGKGEQHVMQSRSIRRSGQPTCASALSNAC